MSEVIRVLLLEEEEKQYHISKDIIVESSGYFQTYVKKPYDLAIITRNIKKEEFLFLEGAVKEYCLYIASDIKREEQLNHFFGFCNIILK